MTGSFRHTPPAPQPWWIERPRVQRRLDRRFAVPVTVIAAPAGYGKTSALAQALALTTDVGGSAGVDLWVQCDNGDADPAVFAVAVLTAARGASAIDRSPALDERESARADWLVDLLAAAAPTDICLVLDDVHHIPVDAPTWRLLDELLGRLPYNAHLLLSGRSRPALALARRSAAGDVELLGTDELAYDDDELQARGSTPTASVPDDAARWPAMAALAEAGAISGAAQFVIEEVVADWSPERFATVAALAHLDDVDDAVATAAARSTVTAAELLAALPLVQRLPSGTFQLHDLYRATLTDPAVWERHGQTAAVVDALGAVAATLLERGDAAAAVELFAAAGAIDGTRAAALAVAALPFLTISAAAVHRCADAVRRVVGSDPLADLLDAASAAALGSETEATANLEAVADEARRRGDIEVEAVALQHAANMRTILDPDTIPEWLAERAEALADSPTARTAAAMVRFQHARAAGDPVGAAEILRSITPPANERERVTLTFGACDIGRPELVDAAYQPGAATELRIDMAAGLWLRGTASPEEALAVGAALVGTATAGGFAHIEVATNATFALIALAAGDGTSARQWTDEATRRASATAARPVQAFAALADALCALAERSEHEAAARLGRVLEQYPIARWPGRPYLFALPSVYLLAPTTRPVLDACHFGPALEAALDAGRALVALRERADHRPATALAWERANLLRAHLQPAHLVELAAAAAADGVAAAEQLLDGLPTPRAHLAAIAADDRHPATAWATARIATMPAPPSYDLRIEVLGPIRLLRGAALVTDHDWVKRDRVRQLLALLTLRRRMPRSAIAETLWPELDVERGLHNLRVNLGHLQRVLQPDRPPAMPAWFVRGDGNWLELVDERVIVDQRRFEEHLAAARAYDGDGRSRAALDTYRRAIALTRGTLLEEWRSAGWAELERLRLHSLATGARCRAGELTLALGEPEEATALAAAVLADEPLQERAARLLVRAFDAHGDRMSARRALGELLSRLADAALAPEPATTWLATALGVPAGTPADHA